MDPLPILLLCALLPAALAQCDLQRARPLLARSAYEFAAQLTARIAQEKENHFVAAPLSAWSLLATASLGAAGDTLDEFRKVLRLHKQPCFNDRYFELVKPTAAADVTLERSSTVFVAEGLRILPEFERRLKAATVSELAVLPFDRPEKVAETISAYVSRATHDAIPDLVAPSDLEGVYVVLIDALYFKGLWQRPFPYEATAVRPFYDDLGTQLGDVNMMRTVGVFNTTTIDFLGAQVVELPFGADGRYAMLVFVPRGNATLSAVIDSLLSVSLTTVYVSFARDDMQVLAVELPKFEVSSDLDNLKELLSDMGLQAPFDSYSAQFPYLSEEELYISNVVQKANIQVSEVGAEASAATAGFLSSRSSPTEFRADRPFFYMIVDTVTQVPLFTGAYSKPSLS